MGTGRVATLPAIPRPDGRLYRPRRVVVYRWENDYCWSDDECGVVVLGTIDIARARVLADDACQYWFGLRAARPWQGWWRDGFRNRGERAWIEDERRGRAGVMFTASEVSDAGRCRRPDVWLDFGAWERNIVDVPLPA